ncbi:MAG: hypothetical protein ACRD3B_01455 [Candidatus Sulfotelmatobacter sp.]
MKTQNFWIEIVLVGAAIACALALLIATLGAAAGTVTGSGNPQDQFGSTPTQEAEQVYEGMITCSRCGARHPAAMNASATACVRSCIHGGDSFSLISNSESTYRLDGDLAVLKKFAGQRARIVGTLTGKTIRVSSAGAI